MAALKVSKRFLRQFCKSVHRKDDARECLITRRSEPGDVEEVRMAVNRTLPSSVRSLPCDASDASQNLAPPSRNHEVAWTHFVEEGPEHVRNERLRRERLLRVLCRNRGRELLAIHLRDVAELIEAKRDEIIRKVELPDLVEYIGRVRFNRSHYPIARHRFTSVT